MTDQKNYNERYFLRLLQHGPFQRRPRGGWRFGVKVISDGVVERLLAGGHTEIAGSQLRLKPLASNPPSGSSRATTSPSYCWRTT
ncbi:hypothetical protein [Bradyrhizobium sp. WSM471]|uniref:hypothetical protein n=1 Tax=Bradyrhizobium sp. WSM471 TaxID=319017 RepID=UPI00024D21D2|nr:MULTISPECIES: hypothetical protein [Bradyrhizobium]EHR01353.1 hypothetical protein Bra471DRAFT_02070 [Bradyrhizobium sp. WSM471]UFW43419.1 hypothetical protein BcanWSM471_10180 [Bradyrhizobium canariense]